jgi:hypothetical protein
MGIGKIGRFVGARFGLRALEVKRIVIVSRVEGKFDVMSSTGWILRPASWWGEGTWRRSNGVVDDCGLKR